MKLDALLTAHAFVRVERPPELWEADTEDVRFLPLLAEMLAAPLSRGAAELAQLTLNVSNVVVEPDVDPEPEPPWPPPGEYVAVTVSAPADLGPDRRWPSAGASAAPGLLDALHDRLVAAGVRFAYIRKTPAGGSLTVALARAAGR